MVGTGRFELPTPRTPSECSTRLSHVPTRKDSTDATVAFRQAVGLQRRGSLGNSTLDLSKAKDVCNYPAGCRGPSARNKRGPQDDNRIVVRGLRCYSRSLQLGPPPIPTCSGTASACTFSICSRTSDCMTSTSFSGTSNTSSSCTCSVILDFSFCSRSAASMRIMAILMRSAAVPCNGVFTAVRSAKPRFHFHVAPGFFQRLIDEGAYAAVLFKIGSNELFGLSRLNAQVLR